MKWAIYIAGPMRVWNLHPVLPATANPAVSDPHRQHLHPAIQSDALSISHRPAQPHRQNRPQQKPYTLVLNAMAVLRCARVVLSKAEAFVSGRFCSAKPRSSSICGCVGKIDSVIKRRSQATLGGKFFYRVNITSSNSITLQVITPGW
jgi:hypothetical protein